MSQNSAQYTVLPEKNVVILVMRGVITFQGVKEVCQKMWLEDNYDRRMRVFCDLRECTYDMGLSGIAKMTSLFLTSNKTSRGHIVVVSDSPEGVANNFIVKRRVAKMFRLSSVSMVESGLSILGLNRDDYNAAFGKNAIKIET